MLRGPLDNVTTSFSGAAFTVLELKIYITTFTTKGGVSWFLYPVKTITNSSILDSKMIATQNHDQLLLQIVT